MISTWTRILLILFMLIFITGCWSRKELNDLGIVSGMAISKAKDGKYEITIQMASPGDVASQEGGPSGVPVSTYTASATTLMEAARKMIIRAPRRLYFAHLRLLIIGKELADEGISQALDFISRGYEFRSDFYIVVAKEGKPEKYLKVMTPIEKIPSQQFFTKLETSEKTWAPTTAVNLDDLIAALVSPGRDPVLTGIDVEGDAKKGNSKENTDRIHPDTTIVYSGIALFKKDKLVGWFNEAESKGYNYLIDKVKETAGDIPCPRGKGKVAIEVIRSKTKLAGKVINGVPEIEVKVELEGNVGEVECKEIDLTKPQTISALEKEAEKKMEGLINHAISKAKKLGTDVFGFGDVIHRADLKYWKTVEKDWNKVFEDVTVHVKTDVKLRRTGTINNSFMKNIKQVE